MDERVRWVRKAEAAEELEISSRTLDRKIRSGEIEVAREGRRVYMRMHGPEYLSDEEAAAPGRRQGERASADRAGAGAASIRVEAQRVRAGAGAGTRPGRPQPPPNGRTTSFRGITRRRSPTTR